MGFFGVLGNGVLAVLAFVWDRFTDWLFIFVSPVKNFDILWIIIPIYLSWIFTEFFQEKERTSFGNAISNGVIPFWAGVDWTRYLVGTIQEQRLPFSWALFFKFALCAALFLYGLTIIIEGIRARRFIHYFGRIREVTYVMLMVTPVIYGVVTLSWMYLVSVLMFFPVFYYVVEWIDRRTPDPESLEIEQDRK